MKRGYIGYLYISPWLIGFLLLTLYPFIESLYYSFTNYSPVRAVRFVGFDNYINIFTNDPDVYLSLKATFIFVLLSVPGKLIFAMLLAVILSKKIPGVNVFRTLFYIPSILGGSVAVAILWKSIFMRTGFVNQLLALFGINAIDWLGNPNIAIFSISLFPIWEFGASMVIFLAGIKQIPRSLYEAAKVDGASGIRTYLNVTLPMLTPLILFNLVLQTIHSFQQFTIPAVVTEGGPVKSTYLFGLMLYQNGFAFSKMGYASAQSWVFFLIIMLFTLLIFKTSKYWTHYEEGEG